MGSLLALPGRGVTLLVAYQKGECLTAVHAEGFRIIPPPAGVRKRLG
jgi:hypothetical protein